MGRQNLFNSTNLVNFSSNILDEDTSLSQTSVDIPTWFSVLEASVCVLIMLSALLSNSLVCYVVYRKRELRTITNVLIVNLSICCIGVALFCLPFSIVAALSQTWTMGFILCNVNGFFLTFFLLASILTLAFISIHKCISVTKPMSSIINESLAKKVVVWIWTQSFLTALCPIIGWNEYQAFPGRYQCTLKAPETTSELVYCIFLMSTGFIIPFIIMCVCYFKIFLSVRNHTRRLRSNALLDPQKLNTEKKIIKTLFIVMTVYVLCWCPLFILTVFGILGQQEKVPLIYAAISYTLCYLSAAVNPVIYALRTYYFKNGCKEVVKESIPKWFINEKNCVFEDIRQFEEYREQCLGEVPRFSMFLNTDDILKKQHRNLLYPRGEFGKGRLKFQNSKRNRKESKQRETHFLEMNRKVHLEKNETVLSQEELDKRSSGKYVTFIEEKKKNNAVNQQHNSHEKSSEDLQLTEEIQLNNASSSFCNQNTDDQTVVEISTGSPDTTQETDCSSCTGGGRVNILRWTDTKFHTFFRAAHLSISDMRRLRVVRCIEFLYDIHVLVSPSLRRNRPSSRAVIQVYKMVRWTDTVFDNLGSPSKIQISDGEKIELSVNELPSYVLEWVRRTKL